MPGIIDADIKDLNRGSIKKATINIKAHNRNQFDVIDALYLRLGYSVMLEWGVDKYLDDLKGGNGDVESMGTTLIDRKFWKYNKSSYNEILPEIEELREKYKGNYDGFFGVISNFSWTFEADGTYNIKLELMSQGDIIESLKANLPATKNQNPTNQYDDLKNKNLEANAEVTQDKFYSLTYPGLKDILTDWFNGGKYGFNLGRARYAYTINQLESRIDRFDVSEDFRQPYTPVVSDGFDFPELKFGNYKNDFDKSRETLIRTGAFAFSGPANDISGVTEDATLYALSLSWDIFALKTPESKKLQLDATKNASIDVKRKFIMDNISLDKFLFYFYEYFTKRNIAGGSEGRLTLEGIEKTEEETKATEELQARVDLDINLQSTRGKNKVFEYLFNIQKEYDNPTSLNITALDKNLGVVINPTSNDAALWNKKVGFPIYSSSERTTKFNALTPEQQEKFARKFGLTAAGYREIYINRVEGTVDVFQLTNLNNPKYQHFIRLGTFLEFFETNIIPKIERGSNKGQPLLLIDFNPLTNICYVIDNEISLDPNKTAISNPEFYVGNPTPQKVYPELNTFIKTVKGFKYGNMMNIYFSFNRIREIMDEVDNNNQISVFKVLKNLATDINDSLGNINNIEPIIDKESNTIRFIDQTPIPGLKTIAQNIPGYDIFEKEEATLEIFGLNPKDNTSNFVRNAGITTEISKEYATIITIGATANGSIPGAEATAFS